MCGGYACEKCGRCKGRRNKNLPQQKDLPGYCPECEYMNGPTAKVCKRCGVPLPPRPPMAFGQ